MQLISVPSNNPPPPVTQSVLTSDVLTVGALVFGVGGFLVKFLFDQAVGRWRDRLEELRKDQAESERNLERRIVELAAELKAKDAVTPKQLEIVDQRVSNLGGALQESQRILQEIQQDQIKLRSTLATDYLRREDWVRFSTTLESKMDSLRRLFDERFDMMLERRIDP